MPVAVSFQSPGKLLNKVKEKYSLKFLVGKEVNADSLESIDIYAKYYEVK